MKIKELLFVSLLLALMVGTAKAQTNTPFLTQGFEDGMSEWSFLGEGAGYGKIVSDYVHSGLKSFRFLHSSDDYGYLISPKLSSSDTEDGVKVSFHYNNRYTSVSTEFKVGYSMTTADPMAFTWGDLVSAYNGSWSLYEKSFPSGIKYIAIAFPNVSGYLYVDDIVLSRTDCAMPSIPSVSNVSSDAISVEWTGSAQGLKCSTLQEYGFEDETAMLSGWTSLGGVMWQWSGDSGIGHRGSHCVLSNVTDNYLVSPLMSLGGRITFYAKGVLEGNIFKGRQSANDYQLNFKVMVTNEENPSVVDFRPVQGAEFEASIDGWMRCSIDLSAYSGQEGHVAIYHCNDGAKGAMNNREVCYLAIDDITLYLPLKETDELTGNSYTIEELDEMTKYAIQLQGCNQWTDALYVATLPVGGIDTYVFVRKGLWNEITNWENWYVPSEGDNVFIKAKARIPANYVAKAGSITFLMGGDPPVYLGSVTIAEGGQLKHSSPNVRVTMEKNIIGYTGEKDNYKLLAFPTANGINLSEITIDNILHHFITLSTFDLYKFDHSQDLEWINYENGSHPFTLIQNGVGYLYANKRSDRYWFNISNLKPSNNNVTKDLAYTSGKMFSGWNLLGNPFACNAYLVDGNDFYRLQEVEGESKIVLAESNVIAPMEGIFVVASDSGESVTFTADEPRGGNMNMMDFTLRKAFMRSDVCLDRARVRFAEGHNMGHLDLMADPNRLYIPMDGKAMAVVNTQPIGELPLNFEAASDGTFVLGFTNKAEGLAYCHLIDNLTGADIDLLQQPEYTFEAKSNNYTSRFRVVFVAKDASIGSVTDDLETFAYNSNGSWIIVNEDHATLQVVDVQGRILSSETIEGCVSKNIQAAPGVYMLRLVKGENVKVQKVVVR